MADLDLVFGALGDATRRGICERLIDGERTISEVAEPYLKEMTFPAITKHLNVLEAAGLIRRRKAGRTCLVSLQAGSWAEATAFLGGLRAGAGAPSRAPGTAGELEIGIND